MPDQPPTPAAPVPTAANGAAATPSAPRPSNSPVPAVVPETRHDAVLDVLADVDDHAFAVPRPSDAVASARPPRVASGSWEDLRSAGAAQPRAPPRREDGFTLYERAFRWSAVRARFRVNVCSRVGAGGSRRQAAPGGDADGDGRNTPRDDRCAPRRPLRRAHARQRVRRDGAGQRRQRAGTPSAGAAKTTWKRSPTATVCSDWACWWQQLSTPSVTTPASAETAVADRKAATTSTSPGDVVSIESIDPEDEELRLDDVQFAAAYGGRGRQGAGEVWAFCHSRIARVPKVADPNRREHVPGRRARPTDLPDVAYVAWPRRP